MSGDVSRFGNWLVAHSVSSMVMRERALTNLQHPILSQDFLASQHIWRPREVHCRKYRGGSIRTTVLSELFKVTI